MATRKAPRIRRSAEEARRLILDAAEKRLAAHGPQGIRLQDVAADVGISHPAVLHHFHSREGLLEAVVKRAVSALETELVGAFVAGALDDGVELSHANPASIEALLERASGVLVGRGHARVMAWLMLEGMAPAGEKTELRTIALAAHARNVKEHGADAAPFEDTLFRFLSAALIMFADAVAGPAMRLSAGLPDDENTARAYRRWLAQLLAPPDSQGVPRSGTPSQGEPARPRGAARDDLRSAIDRRSRRR